MAAIHSPKSQSTVELMRGKTKNAAIIKRIIQPSGPIAKRASSAQAPMTQMKNVVI
jgi:hypothetical protein